MGDHSRIKIPLVWCWGSYNVIPDVPLYMICNIRHTYSRQRCNLCIRHSYLTPVNSVYVCTSDSLQMSGSVWGEFTERERSVKAYLPSPSTRIYTIDYFCFLCEKAVQEQNSTLHRNPAWIQEWFLVLQDTVHFAVWCQIYNWLRSMLMANTNMISTHYATEHQDRLMIYCVTSLLLLTLRH